MKKSTILALLVLLLALAGTASAQPNSITVTAAAAMGPDNGGINCGGGNCGLQADFTLGDTTRAFVRDDTPSLSGGEAVYRVVFWFDPTGLTPNPSSTGFFHVLMRTTETTLFRAPFQLLLFQKFNLNRLAARAETNSAGVSLITNRIDLTGANQIQVTWTQSAAPGTPDGHLLVEVVQGPQTGACVSVANFPGTTQTGINNSNLHVDNILMGAVGNIPTTIEGTEYFDEFQSFRTLGPNFEACP